MLRLRKGIRLESLGLPLKRALETAARIGAEGVEINGRSDVTPADLSRTGLRHLRKMLGDFRLNICCVSFPTRRGFAVIDDLDRRIDAIKSALLMAYDLGCPIVSSSIGRIPDAHSSERQTLVQAIEDIGHHGLRVGATFACRTSDGDGTTIAELIRSLSPGVLSVDFDPAELLMEKHDVEQSMRELGPYVVHFRARDAVRDLSLGKGLEVQ